MPATVNIYERNGTTPGTPTSKGTGGQTSRLKMADNATVDTNDPIVVPTSGQQHSMNKWLQLGIATNGGFTEITNLQVYSDGANGLGTGVGLFYAVDGTYATPSVPDNANDPPLHNASPMVDFFTSNSGARIALGAGPFTPGAEPQYIGDFLVLVMQAKPTASPGITPAETATFSYDEV